MSQHHKPRCVLLGVLIPTRSISTPLLAASAFHYSQHQHSTTRNISIPLLAASAFHYSQHQHSTINVYTNFNIFTYTYV
jgi:hypothetical protein